MEDSMGVLLNIFAEDVQEEIKEHNKEVLELVLSLGGGSRAYARERQTRLRAVAEIYSPPRVIPNLQMIPGFALDLTEVNEKGEPWDFDKPERRKEAWALLEQQQPLFLVGSPMCTAFSALRETQS